MAITRKEFLKLGLVAGGAGLALSSGISASMPRGQPTTGNLLRSKARRGQQRTSRYSTQVAGVLVAAFTLSALYTVISTLSGVIHYAYNPTLWIFYVVGFGLAALARMDRSWSWWIVSAAVLLLILGGIFVYPAYFVPSE